ncbi:MAG: MoxR family ATPase [Candidatus Aenigmarchaeota archaeon]|nr:MoxR family ATPase [Candidatus Aenigmarchaeota archaeon]
MTQNTTPNKSLYDFLIENEFHIDKNLADLIERIITSSSRKAILLRGPAGVGKTQLTYLVAQWLGATYVFYQCTYGTSEDELLYNYVPSETTKSGIKLILGPIPRALVASKSNKVILVLDEFDKTRPSADALLLDVLQNFRVALYIDDNETIIVGNPENLVIFITSNDMREFSEPLLRRVVSITLQPLPTARVLEILSKRFRKEVALLLAQIYDDTIQAGLRKLATLQELYQLGEVLEAGTSIPLNDLIRMFIIKYDDDWQKFKQYIATRKLFQFFEQRKEEEELTKYYEPEEQEVQIQIPQPEQPQQQTGSTSQLLQKIASVVVKQPQRIPEAREEVKEDKEATFKATIAENDVTAYTVIVKELRPEPTETGDVMGKFRVVRVGNETNIISEKPLTISEYLKLVSKRETEFEAYIEDRTMIINPLTIEKLIDSADDIYYYSNKLIRIRRAYADVEELVEVELVNDRYHPAAQPRVVEAVVRAYAKVRRSSSPYSSRGPAILDILAPGAICTMRLGHAAIVPQVVEKCLSIGKLDVTVENIDVDTAKKIIDVITAVAQRLNVRMQTDDNVLSSVQRTQRLTIYLNTEGVLRVRGY